ncbi:DUF2938 domain-containing protein [Aestuariivirga litoralis]|uniref:DUF2938 domain-containing protein n=1 Tax=Aestuariivirga litoralis TaxID=2650924 RepID=A0A2W2B8R6_9HYPH|nr:DUF2938 family protein [Aestuariivirga litoralis]PZF76694.1 DUF2938 domain-containing protein [Aestuariivirga litoralis]
MRRLPPPLAILITGLAGATAADIGRMLYQWVTGFPPVNWSITGRWFLMVLQGQPYVTGIGQAPSLPHELLAGHAAYYTISVVFAAVYLTVLKLMKRKPTLWNGLLFGLVTMAFPFLVQMPLMGMGVLASATATPWLIIGRTLVHHSSFGIGLAVGAMVMGVRK